MVPRPASPSSTFQRTPHGPCWKGVGWFGPSTAADTIKTLVHSFPEAGLGVSVAADSVIYQSDVYAASNVHIGSPRRHMRSTWGERAVLVLIGICLGIDGVNSIYYNTIKHQLSVSSNMSGSSSLHPRPWVNREDQEQPENEDQFFDTHSAFHSPVPKGQGSEADTAEDPIGPITPGPNSMLEVDTPDKVH
ncbi:hypothetical protein EV702DRAFT_1246497 [Suillus placidus]|uniref:Cysteine protease n=1 Tax=Suillus placidus TaxID=48579 RepID=A0A9P6ZMN5_9AGAM|nr:hypothetical protein EV702DRAFT_1246497 [Suillus placidus]